MKKLTSVEKQAWLSILSKIKKQVTPQQFSTWFENLTLVHLDKQSIHIQAPNYYCKNWISKNYMDIMSSSVFETLKNKLDIKLIIEECQQKPKASTKQNLARKQPEKQVNINKTYTFDNFMVGPCNRLAHAAAISICESPGTTYNPLFIHGPVGLGKSHLLQAIYITLQQRSNQHKTMYLPCESFVNHYISTIKTGDWDSFRNTYREIDIMLIDDVHFLANSQNSREEFFHTFNALYNRQKQIVLSSDCPPEDIPTLEDRLISRFRWGLITRIDPPGFETSIAIIQKKASLLSLKITDDVASYLAENVSSNIREIEGAITNINKYASLSNHKINLNLVKQVVQNFTKRRSNIGIEKILGSITKHYGVQISLLHSKSKLKSITLPRQVAMYLTRKLTTLSLEEIGGYMGGRDHTTVMHAIDKIKNMKKTDHNISATLIKIEKELVE